MHVSWKLACVAVWATHLPGCSTQMAIPPQNRQEEMPQDDESTAGQPNVPGNSDDLDETDADQDGLTASIEAALGTSDFAIDSDSDGLTDFEEASVYGTDPTVWDSDGDTLSDLQELFEYGTNPWHSDTDLDGLSDGQEINLTRSNPFERDTDDDGLLDGEEVQLGTDPRLRDSDYDDVDDGQEVRSGTDPLDSHDPPPPRPSSNLFSFLTPDEADLFEAQFSIAKTEVAQWYAQEESRLRRAGGGDVAICNLGRTAGKMLVESFERLLMELVDSIPYQLKPADRREVGRYMHDRFDSPRECDLQDCSHVSVFCQLAR